MWASAAWGRPLRSNLMRLDFSPRISRPIGGAKRKTSGWFRRMFRTIGRRFTKCRSTTTGYRFRTAQLVISTSPRSVFRNNLMLARAEAGVRYTLKNRLLSVRQKDGSYDRRAIALADLPSVFKLFSIQYRPNGSALYPVFNDRAVITGSAASGARRVPLHRHDVSKLLDNVFKCTPMFIVGLMLHNNRTPSPF